MIEKKYSLWLEDVVCMIIFISGIVAFTFMQLGIAMGYESGYRAALSGNITVKFNEITNTIERTTYINDTTVEFDTLPDIIERTVKDNSIVEDGE